MGSSQYLYNAKMREEIAEQLGVTPTPGGLEILLRQSENNRMAHGGIVHLADGDLVDSKPLTNPFVINPSADPSEEFNRLMERDDLKIKNTIEDIKKEWPKKPPVMSAQESADAQTIADAVANQARLARRAQQADLSGDYEGESTGDIFKEFGRNALMSGIMSDPKLKEKFMLAQMFGTGGIKGLSKALGQKAGIEALFRKVGPWGMLMPNQGGPLGLGIMGSNRPNSQKIMQGLFDPRVANRIKFAQMFPGIAATGMIMNKFSPRIPGQTGAVGQGLGPQLANIFSPMLGTRTHAEAERDLGVGFMGGTLGPRIKNLLGLSVDKNLDRRNLNRDFYIRPGGIFGGTVGPRLRDIFTRNRDESPIQEIEVTAQKRGYGDGASPSDRRDFYDPFAASESAPPPLLSGFASANLKPIFSLPSVHQVMASEGMSPGSFFGDENYDVSG